MPVWVVSEGEDELAVNESSRDEFWSLAKTYISSSVRDVCTENASVGITDSVDEDLVTGFYELCI